MIAFWSELLGGAGLYWIISVFASVFQVFLLIGAFLGAGADSGRRMEAHDGGSADGVRLFSFRGLVAFFVGFGWTGVLAQRQGMPPDATVTAAAVSGVVFMLLMFAIMRLLINSRDDDSRGHERAVGLSGRVRATIPARRAGVGQIEFLLQGRLITADAVTDSGRALPPRQGVEITALMPPGAFVVKPAPAASPASPTEPV